MKKHQANLLNYNLFIRTAPIFPRRGPERVRCQGVAGAGGGVQ